MGGARRRRSTGSTTRCAGPRSSRPRTPRGGSTSWRRRRPGRCCAATPRSARQAAALEAALVPRGGPAGAHPLPGAVRSAVGHGLRGTRRAGHGHLAARTPGDHGMTIDLLAFGAHPDDAELGAAGTLIRAARDRIENGRDHPDPRRDGHPRATRRPGPRSSTRPPPAMGLAHHAMLGLPDGRLQLRRGVARCRGAGPARAPAVRRPRALLGGPSPRSPAASRIVQEAAFLAGLARRDTGQEPHRPAQLVYYMATWEFEPSFVVDISEYFEKKQAVLLQATRARCTIPAAGTAEPGTFISSEHYWELLAARAAHYGRLIGKAYGEPFRIRGLVEIPDLRRRVRRPHLLRTLRRLHLLRRLARLLPGDERPLPPGHRAEVDHVRVAERLRASCGPRRCGCPTGSRR